VVPVITPAQLSVVVGAVTVALHCPVIVLKTGVTGLMVSSTVTDTVHVLLFPAASVAVRVTLLTPVLLQSKLLLLMERVGVPQLSLAPALT